MHEIKTALKAEQGARKGESEYDTIIREGFGSNRAKTAEIFKRNNLYLRGFKDVLKYSDYGLPKFSEMDFRNFPKIAETSRNKSQLLAWFNLRAKKGIAQFSDYLNRPIQIPERQYRKIIASKDAGGWVNKIPEILITPSEVWLVENETGYTKRYLKFYDGYGLMVETNLSKSACPIWIDWFGKIGNQNIEAWYRKGLLVKGDESANLATKKIMFDQDLPIEVEQVVREGTIELDIQDIALIRNKLAEIAKKEPKWLSQALAQSFSVKDLGSTMMQISGREIAMSNVQFGFVSNTYRRSYCPAQTFLEALQKIEKGEALTFWDEYSIESLWHEILHHRAKNQAILAQGSIQEMLMEAVNQLVSRYTYPKLLKILGKESIHQDVVIRFGLGYQYRVQNLHRLIEKLGIEESEAITDLEGILLGQDHAKIDALVLNYLVKKSGKLKDGIKFCVQLINDVEFDEFLLKI